MHNFSEGMCTVCKWTARLLYYLTFVDSYGAAPFNSPFCWHTGITPTKGERLRTPETEHVTAIQYRRSGTFPCSSVTFSWSVTRISWEYIVRCVVYLRMIRTRPQAVRSQHCIMRLWQIISTMCRMRGPFQWTLVTSIFIPKYII